MSRRSCTASRRRRCSPAMASTRAERMERTVSSIGDLILQGPAEGDERHARLRLRGNTQQRLVDLGILPLLFSPGCEPVAEALARRLDGRAEALGKALRITHQIARMHAEETG